MRLKKKIQLSCDLAIALLTKKNENHMSTKYFYNICCNFIYNSQKLETTEISINLQSIKLWFNYKIECYLTIKIECITDTHNNMDEFQKIFWVK